MPESTKMRCDNSLLSAISKLQTALGLENKVNPDVCETGNTRFNKQLLTDQFDLNGDGKITREDFNQITSLTYGNIFLARQAISHLDDTLFEITDNDLDFYFQGLPSVNSSDYGTVKFSAEVALASDKPVNQPVGDLLWMSGKDFMAALPKSAQ